MPARSTVTGGAASQQLGGGLPAAAAAAPSGGGGGPEASRSTAGAGREGSVPAVSTATGGTVPLRAASGAGASRLPPPGGAARPSAAPSTATKSGKRPAARGAGGVTLKLLIEEGILFPGKDVLSVVSCFARPGCVLLVGSLVHFKQRTGAAAGWDMQRTGACMYLLHRWPFLNAAGCSSRQQPPAPCLHALSCRVFVSHVHATSGEC